MKAALLTKAQVDSLRPSLDAIATQLAERATDIGSKIPPDKRPPEVYSPGAIGWNPPFNMYPQSSGRSVVVMKTAAWSRLTPASRALFVDFPDQPTSADYEAIAPGFFYGQA